MIYDKTGYETIVQFHCYKTHHNSWYHIFKMKSFIVILICSLQSIKSQETDKSERCLLKSRFYDPDSDQCYNVLDQGPCQPGHMFLPDINNLGVGKCTKSEIKDCHHPVVMEDGSLGCQDILLHSMFTQANCSDGEVLIPNNFQVDTHPCPDKEPPELTLLYMETDTFFYM